MKGSVNKGFITYLLLFLGIIVGVVLVCLTIMMFSPGTEILGYVYYRGSGSVEIRSYNGVDQVKGDGKQAIIKNGDNEVLAPNQNPNLINFDSLAKIVVKTNSAAVNFIHGQQDRVDVVSSLLGFNKKSEIDEYVVTKQYDAATQTLTITAFHPSLLLTINNNSTINVIIKNQTPNLNVEVETVNAPITFAEKEFSSLVTRDLTALSFKATTQNANVTVGVNGKITNNFESSVKKANITVKSDLGVENNKLAVANFSVENGNVSVPNVYANTLNLAGETAFVSITKVVANVECDIARGNIEINEIKGNLNASEDVIGTRMIIGSVSSFTLPANKTGYISIGKTTGTAYIRSTSGNIEIKDAKNVVNIETTTGNIKAIISSNFATLLKTTAGNITAAYHVVLNSNTIQTQTGVVNVYYKENSLDPFILTATTTKTIKLIAEAKEFTNTTVTGYPTQSDQPFESSNSLTITSKANINVDRVQVVDWELIA